MTWFGYVFVATSAVNALAVVAAVGKRREPMSPGSAAAVVAINALLIWGAIAVGTTP